MKRVFADASYWIALLNPTDALHEKAKQAIRELGDCLIVTTEMVLVELLNGLSGAGSETRKVAVQTVKGLQQNPNVMIVPQTSLQFDAAAKHYGDRLDKSWGATDCASFLTMREKRLTEALTADHHFEQASFIALLRQ